MRKILSLDLRIIFNRVATKNTTVTSTLTLVISRCMATRRFQVSLTADTKGCILKGYGVFKQMFRKFILPNSTEKHHAIGLLFWASIKLESAIGQATLEQGHELLQELRVWDP